MDCKEFEKQIPGFIKRKLNYKILKKFCEHVESCNVCKEELLIQILVIEGLNCLEEGDAFDLQEELNKRLLEAQRKVKVRKTFLILGIAIEILAVLATIGIIIWLLV